MKIGLFRLFALYLLLISCASGVGAWQDASESSAIFRRPEVRNLLDYLEKIEPETIEEQIRTAEIPSPTFKEQQRAEYYRQRFIELGLEKVRIDGVGNTIGERPGLNSKTTLVLAAHLDTVFPEGTDVKVKRDGKVLAGPGIGDDCRGLAVMLAVARALKEGKVETGGTIIFVANVGEEGLGDLRGARHLFNDELKGRITHFISIDGTGLGITNAGVGSNRYRATFRGPGGHSYGAFGLPSPIHAMGRAIEIISRFEVPKQPRTTFNVGRIEGGTSVNSIAHTAWMEVDMRSESAPELAKLDAKFKQAVLAAVDEENNFRAHEKKIEVEMKLVGQRPVGEQPADAPIIKIALAANAALGIKSELDASSTDSNVPMSLGIPAITIDGGGRGRGSHSLSESFDTTDSHIGTQRALLIVLGIVGVK